MTILQLVHNVMYHILCCYHSFLAIRNKLKNDSSHVVIIRSINPSKTTQILNVLKSYTVFLIFRPQAGFTNLSLHFPIPTYVPLHVVSEPLIKTPDKQK